MKIISTLITFKFILSVMQLTVIFIYSPLPRTAEPASFRARWRVSTPILVNTIKLLLNYKRAGEGIGSVRKGKLSERRARRKRNFLMGKRKPELCEVHHDE